MYVSRYRAAYILCSACLIALSMLGVCMAQDSVFIPESEIDAMQSQLAQGATKPSAVETRRACKSVIRKAEDLLEASPEAPNRFEVLDVLFQATKRLLVLETTDKNREAVFRIADQLLAAPDEYAETRLEADILLSEKELAENQANVEERVNALKGILAKYRGTPAERRSLTIAAMIASKLHAFDLQEEIRQQLAGSSFGGDHMTIAYRRKTQLTESLDVVFSGSFESIDGTRVRFPFDRLGHQYLVIFWSVGSHDYEGFLARVREQQERFPKRFDVYSFNLDGLPDAGRKILERAGLDCMAFHLPGGKASSTYRAYGQLDPMALFVNGLGHVILKRGQTVPWPGPTRARKGVPASPGPGISSKLDDNRYLAQLRSLFIGDFLLGSGGSAEGIPAEVLQEIGGCFAPMPFRCRLPQRDSLAAYRRAEKLSSAAIKKYAEAEGLWRVRNARIVALMGMWNLGVNPSHLEEAFKESKAVLAMKTPGGADLIARFCIAKDALRAGESRAEDILKRMLEECGGDDAPPMALAAAAIVAIEANAEELYQEYRGRFRDVVDEDDPSTWAASSFLRDAQHNYRLFWANPGRWGMTRKQRYAVKYIISGLDGSAETNRFLKLELKDLTGAALNVPSGAASDLMGVLFAEPPGDGQDHDAFVKLLKEYAERFLKKDVPVLVAFLSEDVKRIEEIVKETDSAIRAGIVPGGLSNPAVRQYGILRPDRMPTPFLLRGDGRIFWTISGLKYPIHGGATTTSQAAHSISLNIEKVRNDSAFIALEKGDFEKALSMFDVRVPPKMPANAWTHDLLQGKALALMGLNQWGEALIEMDAALARRRKVSRWGRKDDQTVAEAHLLRASILRKLGREEEAAVEEKSAQEVVTWIEKAPYFHPPSYARNGVPVGVYTDWMKRVRVSLESRK